MASLGVDFRSFILAQSALTAYIGTRCYQNEVTQDGADVSDYIWFERASIEREQVLNAATGVTPFREQLNIECVSINIDSTMAMADALRKLDGSRGTFGSGDVVAVFIDEHSDDYIPRADASDTGRHVASLIATVVGHIDV